MKKSAILIVLAVMVSGCRFGADVGGDIGGTTPPVGPPFDLVEFMAAAQVNTNITLFARAFTKVAEDDRLVVLPLPRPQMRLRVPNDEAIRSYISQKGQSEDDFLADSDLKYFVRRHLFHFPAKTAEESASFLNVPSSARVLSGLKVDAKRITPELRSPKTIVPWEERGCEIKLVTQDVEAEPFISDVIPPPGSKFANSGLRWVTFWFVSRPLVK